MSTRKALFFDIDGTLLSEVTKTVPESAKKAISIARSLGHLVFINTGRSYGEIDQVRDIAEVDGWLCGCGTYVESEGRVILNQLMPTGQVQRITRLAVDADADIFLEGPGQCYYCSAAGRIPFGQQLRKNFGKTTAWLEPEDVDGEVNKFCVLTDDQSDRAGFFRNLDLDIAVIDRGDGFYECIPEGFSKATAIDVILEAYGLTLEDAYVFGDSTNDIAMFEHVPNAVLMGRHSPELEPYASFLTKTVEQDGIWYAMETLGLLQKSNA
ncbi:HAD family hydrolase [Clostridium sp. OM02-18AC]|uniref:HAD hydrolase family protein n=1 Tax=Clostridium sp. OM02-18AC TaxID=2292311 RepID=UPI000E4A376B|nr:HAD hydrolase family protein [Clostridium sp. OM02-18AC]RHV62698.1 HAD family hydrolase [Clostridium sp. OM02-18AC]